MKILNRIGAFLVGGSLISATTGHAALESWEKALGAKTYQRLMSSPACQNFERVALRAGQQDSARKNKDILHTDQILVLKNNKLAFSASDGIFRLNRPHSLWSGSKSITTTLVGAAIQRGWLNLDDRVQKFLPQKSYRAHMQNSPNEHLYAQIRIRDLLSMTSNIVWDESYTSNISESTFLPMLYGWGRGDMLSYVMNQPLDVFGPGVRFSYNGGNSIILMKILQKLAGQRGIARGQMPRHLLFDKLGLKQAFFETDAKGIAIGNSYAYLTPEEMMRVGMLYLNGGRWGSEQILPERWTQDAGSKTDGVLHIAEIERHGKKALKEFKAHVVDEGVYSQRGFWLNQDVPGVLSREFPNSPHDLYFAAGHFGQLIMVIPSQNMVIVRTGSDEDYWKKIDGFVSGVVGCFNSSAWRNAYATH